MKRVVLSTGILLISALFGLTGCTGMDPTPKAIDMEKPIKKMTGPNLNVSIKKGETLKEVIKNMQETNKEYIIVDKIENDIVFDRTIENISSEELKQYLKVTINKNINFRKYSDKIITVEERIVRNKKDFTVKGTYKIPEKEININDKFTYEEIFSLLREEKINIYTDIYKDNGFDLRRQVPQFKGSLKEFLNFIATNERLFVVIEDNGVKLKDVQTVTYNLKLPKVDLAPALSSDGSSAVISVGSAISGSVNSGENTGGSIDPLKSLEEQITAMVPKEKATFNVNKTNGTLSVTGDYESMKIIDMLVEDFQSIYDSAIKLELHIYQVELNNDNAFGIDYNVLKNDLVGNTIQASTNAKTGLTDALTLTAAASNGITYNENRGMILSTQDTTSTTGTGTTSSTTTTAGTSAFEQTQGLIFKYLNKYGKTSVLTKPTLGTINNLPVSLDVVDSKDYVAKIEKGSSTSSTNSGLGTSSSSVNIDIETVTTGYSLVLHPKIDGEYVQVAMKNIASVLNSLDAYTYQDGEDKNTLYLKNVSAKQFNETVKVKEGEIAIIGGYMSGKDSSLKNGLPFTTEEDSGLDALTSAKETSKHKFEIVITISASVI